MTGMGPPLRLLTAKPFQQGRTGLQILRAFSAAREYNGVVFAFKDIRKTPLRPHRDAMRGPHIEPVAHGRRHDLDPAAAEYVNDRDRFDVLETVRKRNKNLFHDEESIAE